MHIFNQIKTIIFIGLLLCIAACSHKKNLGNQNMIRLDILTEVPYLDPALSMDISSTRVSFDLFAGLVDFDQQNNIIPGMAESWNISSDGKTYIFHLRPNLKFSDGSPITAKDFVYTFRHLVDPKTASTYNYILDDVINAKSIGNKEAQPDTLGVYAPDQNTFIVKLVRNNPVFIKALILPNVFVVPEKVIEKYGESWTETNHIVTSGAYVLKEHVVNGYMLAVKNPYYYDRENVHISQVKYLPYGSINAAVPSYKSGGLDLVFQNLPVDQYRGLKLRYPKEVHTVLQEAVYYYDFNMRNPELANNLKLRMALSMAIDRQVLTGHVLMQGQLPLYSLVTSTVEKGIYANIKYEWESWPRDRQISEARRLYKEAGYGPNKEFQATISYNTGDLHKKTALAIASMWADVLGVQTVNQNQEWKTFIQDRIKGDYQIARDGWVADYDSVTSYTLLYTCANAMNNFHYCNHIVDKLIEQAQNSNDAKEQLHLYSDAIRLILNDYPVIPLFQYTYTEMYKPYIRGYDINHNYLEHQQTKWMHLDKVSSGN